MHNAGARSLALMSQTRALRMIFWGYQERGTDMKKAVFTVLVALATLCAGTISYAAGASSPGLYEFDGSIGPATGPDSYDGGFGLNFGGGYMLKSINPDLQVRFDLSFYYFKEDFFWGSGTYTRVPIIISARYYVPIADRVRVFGQAGLEISIDNFDHPDDTSESEVNVGIAPGAGIEFFVNPNVSIFALGIAHVITDSYFSMQFGVATHF
jgi:opacity protein-like surface antigen